MFNRSNPVTQTAFLRGSSFGSVQLEEKKNIFRNLLSATTKFFPLSFATANDPGYQLSSTHVQFLLWPPRLNAIYSCVVWSVQRPGSGLDGPGFEKGKRFSSSPTRPHQLRDPPASYSMDIRVLSRGWSGRAVMLTIYFHREPGLRMSGDILPSVCMPS